jgi:hypothetical protein
MKAFVEEVYICIQPSTYQSNEFQDMQHLHTLNAAQVLTREALVGGEMCVSFLEKCLQDFRRQEFRVIVLVGGFTSPWNLQDACRQSVERFGTTGYPSSCWPTDPPPKPRDPRRDAGQHNVREKATSKLTLRRVWAASANLSRRVMMGCI